MKKVVLASQNSGKLKEMRRLLGPLGLEVVLMDEVCKGLDIEETGTTFEENAYIKAKEIFDRTGLMTISDDSGLEVDFLDGAPGVYTARYAGEHGNSDKNIDKLLGVLGDIEKEKRGAQFVSVICCILESGKVIYTRGECRGYIGYERIGDGGFGYDPVFMVGDVSFASMDKQTKDKLSHRGIAVRELVNKLKGELNVNQ